VHALAGDLACAQRGVRGLIARDLIEFLPAAQRALDPRELK
jgi:NAD(P)H-hydrate repair Nnr-like enzyme with NAD(P)H-hydrate dehydratase domain